MPGQFSKEEIELISKAVDNDKIMHESIIEEDTYIFNSIKNQLDEARLKRNVPEERENNINRIQELEVISKKLKEIK